MTQVTVRPRKVQRLPSPKRLQKTKYWDEEVTVQADPAGDKAIAGTAAGAILGGALAKKLSDNNGLVTAA